jgi:hypothetical protein
MHSHSALFTATILFFVVLHGVAQQTPAEAVESILEDILPVQYEAETDVSLIYENLIQFYQEPLNINAAGAGDLRLFFFLSERQINNILRYREHYGHYLSHYELQYVPGMDRLSIERLLPFIRIEGVESRKLALKKRWQQATNRYLILRQSRILEPQRGYLIADTLTDAALYNHYPGSPHQLYSRLRISRPGSMSLGFTMEKDAGEQWKWQPAEDRYGADFWSYHVQLERVGPLDQVTVGDFTLQTGQQLVLGSGLGLGKGAMTVRSVGRSQQGVRPYTSAIEGGHFRGSAVSLKIPYTKNRLGLTAFFSSTRRHASLKYSSVAETAHFNTIDQSGLFRTQTELQKKNQVDEQTTGINLFYTNRFQNLQAGVNFLNLRYSIPQLPNQRLYKAVGFQGKHHQLASSYFTYQKGHWHAFGEMAISSDWERGLVGGISAVLNSYLESVWLFRHYSQGFHSPFGNSFGEASRNTNEEGLYWGLQLEPFGRVRLSAFYDVFRFQWLRFRVDAPSRGYEYLVRASYEINRDTDILLQYRQESKGTNLSSDTVSFRPVENGIRRNAMLIFEHRPAEVLRLKTRLHHSAFSLHDSLSYGWVAAQDISYTWKRLKLDARIAFISTDDYQNRQYLYENDLLYSFTVPAYAGHGFRYYLLMRYKLNRYLSSWVRWSTTIYEDRDVVGSSLDEIDGNRRSQIKVQLIYKF